MDAVIKNKIRNVTVLVMDVDGVLTDGRIIYDHQGRDVKAFDVQDGFGLVLLSKGGLKTAIITAKSSRAVTERARHLGIHKVYQNAYPKRRAYQRLLKDLKVKDADICYIGDDLPDLPLFDKVGFSVAVANAAPELIAQADYITRNLGGRGAVREVVELILKTQNKWKGLLKGL